MALRRLAASPARAIARTCVVTRAYASASSPFDAHGAEVDTLRVELTAQCDAAIARGDKLNWVFLGATGVGKGTYASRMAKLS